MYHVNPDHQGSEAVFGDEARTADVEPDRAGEQTAQQDPSILLINDLGLAARLGADRVKTRLSGWKGVTDFIKGKDRDPTPPHDYPGV